MSCWSSAALFALDAGDRLARAAAGVDESRGVAGSGARHLRVDALLGRPPAVVRARTRRDCTASSRNSAVRMAAAGHPLDASAGPVITNFPIWMAETQRIPTLALPNEPPADVLDMARSFDGHPLPDPRPAARQALAGGPRSGRPEGRLLPTDPARSMDRGGRHERSACRRQRIRGRLPVTDAYTQTIPTEPAAGGEESR